ncbi:hypothetical protein BKH42_00625 [Helicobacter sp. 13S00482-2]|uniref:hypothetical protein n=1 Tax=Helicobacter sp. 13S00482-2 TaxID=1476200 RepID=UPI000BA70558|nr:hypothetical protein [Helicobacter sp. 13S00482-2]PAF54451.1 hypothetical protein BKH42_00625 [Helicobacter sp. 13S00482-2]
MDKKTLIILSSIFCLSVITNAQDLLGTPDTQSNYFSDKTMRNASIARDKSRFFMGGIFSYTCYDDELKLDQETTRVTLTPTETDLVCTKLPDGKSSCHGSYVKPGGYSTTQNNIKTSSYSGKSSVGYGGRFGYNYFFTPRNGLRFIVSFTTGNLKLNTHKYAPFVDFEDSVYYTASAGIDYLFDFTKGRSPFGIFLGLGYDYNFGEMFNKLKEKDSPNVNIKGGYMNFGVSQTIARRIRIDVGCKVRLYDYYDIAYQMSSATQIGSNTSEQIDIYGKDTLRSTSFYMALDLLF